MRSLPDILDRGKKRSENQMEETVFQEPYLGSGTQEQVAFQSLFSEEDGDEKVCQSPASEDLEGQPALPNMEAFELFSEEETPSQEEELATEEHIPPPPPEKSPEEQRIEAMRQEAEEALQKAEETVRTMEEQALQEAEKIKQSARDEGFSEGHAAGLSEGRQEGRKQISQELLTQYQHLFQSADQAVKQLEDRKREFSQSYLEDLRDLVITVAEKVISVSLKSSGKVIEGMMRSAVGARQAKRLWANVSISEADYQGLLENGITPEKVLEEAAESVRLTVVEMAEPGTCLIEFPEEIIDASVSTQIANIKKMVKNIGTTP